MRASFLSQERKRWASAQKDLFTNIGIFTVYLVYLFFFFLKICFSSVSQVWHCDQIFSCSSILPKANSIISVDILFYIMNCIQTPRKANSSCWAVWQQILSERWITLDVFCLLSIIYSLWRGIIYFNFLYEFQQNVVYYTRNTKSKLKSVPPLVEMLNKYEL